MILLSRLNKKLKYRGGIIIIPQCILQQKKNISIHRFQTLIKSSKLERFEYHQRKNLHYCAIF